MTITVSASVQETIAMSGTGFVPGGTITCTAVAKADGSQIALGSVAAAVDGSFALGPVAVPMQPLGGYTIQTVGPAMILTSA